MTTVKVPPSECPMCGYRLDAMTGMREGRDLTPDPHTTATICISCSSILFLNEDMSVRNPKPGELEQFAAEDPESYKLLMHAQKLCRGMDRTKINNG